MNLLDQHGLDAIKMRDVAKRAGTTTPTLYERFRDRESLLWGLIERIQADIYPLVADAKTLPEMADILIRYMRVHPGRLDIMHQHWPKMMFSQHPKPVFELAIRKLIEEKNHSPKAATEKAYSLTALLFGTTLLIRNAGPQSDVALAVWKSSLKAVQMLCEE